MNIGGVGGTFTSDIDIIARLHDYPNSQEWFYKTWEVKVSILLKNGEARSLKSGKTKRTITQLKSYKEFGSPDVNLLDVYICESEFMKNNPFPPPIMSNLLNKKYSELTSEGFGYQLLPFEHDKEGNNDFGLKAIRFGQNYFQRTSNLLSSANFGFRQPFSRLVNDINIFYDGISGFKNHPHKPFRQIVYCRNCHTFQLINMKTEFLCPNCRDNFIGQS